MGEVFSRSHSIILVNARAIVKRSPGLSAGALMKAAASRSATVQPPDEGTPFQRLPAVLRQQLSGVKVYKVGDAVEKQVCVVGATKDGALAGLRTAVVET
jgi:hypothetical protein